MAKSPKTVAVQIRLSGLKGEVDGYMELVLGMFVMTGVIVSCDRFAAPGIDGQQNIYMEFVMLPPPLGNIGESDLPPYTGDNP